MGNWVREIKQDRVATESCNGREGKETLQCFGSYNNYARADSW